MGPKKQLGLLTILSQFTTLVKLWRVLVLIAGLTSIRMGLTNVLYISYLVPSIRIRPLVPSFLSLATNQADQVYLSFVAMKCNRVRLAALPWPRFDYDQLNLRTYVIDPNTGEPAVYFFRSGVSLGVIPLLTRILGIPWEKIAFKMDFTSRPRYRASGHWLGDINCEIDAPAGVLPAESVIEHLTGPMRGFIGSEGKVRSFRIDHRTLEIQPALLRSIEFPLPVKEGLIMESELRYPDTVLIVPRAEFTIYLPPQRFI